LCPPPGLSVEPPLQVAALLTEKVHIAAATYRIRLEYRSMPNIPYTLQWVGNSPAEKFPFCVERNPGCHLIHGFFGPPDSAPKWHLDRFSRVCRAHGCHKQTDGHTDHRTSVTTGRVLCSGVLGGIRGYTPYTNLRVFFDSVYSPQ